MEAFGVHIEHLPVSRILDTQQLAKEHRGKDLSLKSLLRTLGIDWPHNALHCAGNDAYFTMRAMLCMLEKRHEACCGGFCCIATNKETLEVLPLWQSARPLRKTPRSQQKRVRAARLCLASGPREVRRRQQAVEWFPPDLEALCESSE